MLVIPDTPAIVFSDFDGTITLQDSNDYLTDHFGFGREKRVQLNQDVLDNKMSFRDAFEAMLNSVKTPFPQCVDTLCKNVRLDQGFKQFYEWCTQRGIMVIVLSSGMEPIIRALLRTLVGEREGDQIQIVSNQVNIESSGNWNIVFHDDSHFGHDKSLAIKPFASLPAESRPKLFYCGDGVSDLSAAKETDLLFAKQGRDLVTYCLRENVDFTLFQDFTQIHDTIRRVVDGMLTIEEAAAQGRRAAASMANQAK